MTKLQRAGAGEGVRVLVVDDEPYIGDLLATGLRFVGHEVAVAATGREALDAVNRFLPELILLDVMLPDLDGFEVCRHLRRDGVETPVLFLTAKDGTEDKVSGLRLGGDDYVTKPFSLEEVMARIDAVLRRSRPGVALDGRMELADLVLDERSHQVFRAGGEVDLSPTEFRLLRYLLANSGRVVSRLQILDNVWDGEVPDDSTVVETYISYLRRKVDRREPCLIHTVRGVGYCLRLPAASHP